MEERFHTVLVDDDTLFREFMSLSLSNKCNYIMYQADSSETTTAILDRNIIDCVILDYNLGTETGLRIGELIKNKYSDPPPIVMLTGEGGERTIIKAFRGGFSDFVLKKNLHLDELIGAIRGAVSRTRIDRSIRAECNRLERLSGFDMITGLHTAEFMKERVQELAESAGRRRGHCGVIMIRIDQLDSITDRFGHVIRDRALFDFAARLRETTSGADICGRNSRHSFLYLIDREAGSEAIVNTCKKLSKALSFKMNFETASFGFTPSIGVAVCPFDGANAEQLLAAADAACDDARLRGDLFAIASHPPTQARVASPSSLSRAYCIEHEIAPSELSELIGDRHTNRRIEPRRRVLKRGKIIANQLDSIVDCTIRDLSSSGARLRLGHPYNPPDRFELVIVDAGNRQSVEVRWRIGDEVGVRFLGLVDV